jgi:DMSO/TMAO reductase YedYZ molybdopterin-dependent catalytic subunit
MDRSPLPPLLEEAGLREDVTDLIFTGYDRGFEGGSEQDYQRSLPLRDALHEGVILAWAMNSRPLEPQHGYPVRLVVPGWYGMAHVKWIDISADGGATWTVAEVDEPPSPYCWQAWHYVWDAAELGDYDLRCRAHDSAGNVQPTEQSWAAQGVSNNMAQRVRVQVV